ncbi:MAG TPA: PqqD family protein [Nocardioides sp.]|uniref:PqqD family protein n=1 Tax=Nocardioides sp. TaxID=35761 RepID=UPI002E326D09|nr:PqqD family protein [Nocardioides sp.]HEX3932686.1 PqqD family protein [Nocardioides sp.]
MAETSISSDADQPRPAVWRRATSTAYVASTPGSPDRAVVLDLSHPERPPYVFEDSAARIWECLDGERTEAEVADHLAEEFEVEAGALAADVRGFLGELERLGLAEQGPS